MSGFPFLGYTFEPLKLEHQHELEVILKRCPNRISGYTFGSLMAWNTTFNYAWAFCSTKTLLICHREENTPNYHLMQPEGLFGIPCQQKILEHAPALPYALKIIGVSAPFILLHYPFYKHFQDCTVRKMANYLYRADDLATLDGRRYAKKRNLIHQAEQAYQWTSKPITDETVKDCHTVLREIARTESSNANADELTAIEYTLAHFSQLKQRGCIIYVEGQPAAFSIYEELAPDTSVIHFEKALKSYKGLYQLINREAARNIVQAGYTYINREEDMGNEGLRQAKLSYYPSELVPFHILRFRQ